MKAFGRAIGDRAARGLAAAAHLDPADVEQRVERALGNGHAADVLDLGARHRLVIGDDRQRLEAGLGQALLLLNVLAQHEGHVLGGAEHELARQLHKVDTPVGIILPQVLQQGLRYRPYRADVP
jgi:hypothetical protein